MTADVPGVCASADIWPLRPATDSGGCSLPTTLPVEVCLRREVSILLLIIKLSIVIYAAMVSH